MLQGIPNFKYGLGFHNVACRRQETPRKYEIAQGQAFFLVKKTQPVPVDNNDQSTNDQPTASTSQQGEGNAAVCALTLTKMKGKQWMPVTLADKVTKAEILMASKLVTSNYSFSSYAEMGEILQTGVFRF